MADFLIFRSADHLVLGVRWSGMSIVNTPDGPALRADGSDARLVLMFPPQHVGEETSSMGADATEHRPDGLLSGELPHMVPVWRALLSGPSEVGVRVEAGARVALTVAALLDAVAARPLSDTVVELPFRLRTTPEPVAGMGPLRATHPADTVTIGEVTGLWRTSLHADGAGPPDAGLALRPLDSAELFDPFWMPTQMEHRALIRENGPARTTQLDLSALGATASINAVWPNVEWEHRIVHGRDMKVRFLVRGMLYPFGHRAEYVEYAVRIFDPAAGGAAVLRQVRTLTVTEPARRPPVEESFRRAFPFDDVVITQRQFTDVTPDWRPDEADPRYFWPMVGATRLRFPIACHTARGPVTTSLPMLFVTGDALADRSLGDELAHEYGRHTAPLPGVTIDLVRAAQPADGDLHEVHSLVVEGGVGTDGFRPRLTGMEVALPALRALLGDEARRTVAFTDQYLRDGTATDIVLKVAGESITVGFAGQADRSGALVSPSFAADALSRVHGPVNLSALPAPATGLINPAALFGPDATVLGFRLSDLLTELRVPPRITTALAPGAPPKVSMVWQDVKLTSFDSFVATAGTRVDLTAEVGPDGSETRCVVRDFAMEFPPRNPLLRLTFGAIIYTQRSGRRPHLDVEGLDAKFLGVLQLLQELENAVDLDAAGQVLDVAPTGITVRYTLPVPSVSAGAFVLRDIMLRVAVEVPFDEKPVTVSIGFAERQNPFALSVLMFGGGGHIELAFDRDGLKRLEAALEFGAIVAVDFLVASGEVHALGGVRFALEADGSVTLAGYLRIGGCVEVLGLVSVSIEMRIELAYQSARKALVGRASIVIEIDLTLWSDSVEIDSGEWVLAGGSAHDGPLGLLARPRAESDDALARWRAYRGAFAHDSRGGTP